MPYIPSPNDHSSSFEKFNMIVDNYKHIIEYNATARCMIGFAAAALIRSEGGAIDIESFERWLQSIVTEKPPLEEAKYPTQINKILHVVKADYYNNQEEQASTVEEGEHQDAFLDKDDKEAYQLNRFMSRDPYSSTKSYPSAPQHATLNYSSVDYLFFPSEEQHCPPVAKNSYYSSIRRLS